MCFVSSFRLSHFRPGRAFILHSVALQRLEPHKAALKIKHDAKVSKKVSAEDAALLKPRGFVHRFQIEDRSVDFFARVGSDSQLRQQGHLYVFRNSGRAKDTHSALLNETLSFVACGQLLSKDGYRGASVEDEIERFLDSFDRNLAAEKAAGGRSHRDFDSCSRFDGSTAIVFTGAVHDGCEVGRFAAVSADQIGRASCRG